MKAQDFLDWMEKTNCTTAADVAMLLGIHRNPAQLIVRDVKRGDDVDIKYTVALAMAAVAAKIPAWREEHNFHV